MEEETRNYLILFLVVRNGVVDEIWLRVRQRTIRSNVIVTLGLQFSFSYKGWLQPRLVIQLYFDQGDGIFIVS